ncbi:hypothetical protein IFM51744_10733 [Aspergillus udagawae]|uniref:Uncharacterized protein n=1 Tax=Aspergillus udagawae TaxID=91492 RepID=A0ABQ1BFC4_9EURO|nr:hypothetical protein IFM51744_10733 [Aspergillus udagawae]GFG00997.1 hypothetical protein IFM53868_10912 [Aspergillus udagawae]
MDVYQHTLRRWIFSDFTLEVPRLTHASIYIASVSAHFTRGSSNIAIVWTNIAVVRTNIAIISTNTAIIFTIAIVHTDRSPAGIWTSPPTSPASI